jgi:PAS domain S-box-containing protein
MPPNTTSFILHKLPVVVFEYTYFSDSRAEFTYISPNCQEMFGVASETLIGGPRSLISFVHPEDRSAFAIQCESWIKNVESFEWEGRVIHASGKVIWINAKANAYKTEEGKIVWTGVLADVSMRKYAEKGNLQAAHDTDGRYRALVESLPLGVGIHQNGRLVYVNSYAAKLMGASSPSGLIGIKVLDLVHPDYKATVLDRIKKLMNGKPVPTIREKYIRLDGKEILVETSAMLFSYEGKPAIQIVAKDVTEEHETKVAIRKSETLFTQLFHHSPFGKVMLDEKGKVVLANQGFEKMFGFTHDELVGQLLNKFIVPDDLKEEGNDLDSLISSRKIVSIESVRMRKNKTKLAVIIYGVPVLLEDKAIGIFGSYVDITDQKRIEDELKVRNAELDNFVYKVSHDLRAPLSSVLGLVNLARMEGNDDNLEEYIELIGQKVLQLDHFIGDVLSHSKNLKLEVTIEKIDLQNLIEETFKELNYLKGADQIKKTIVIKGEALFSDRWRVGEIFRNLISNAIKYRDFEKPIAEININIRINEDRVVIIFSDNGIGISKPNQEKIFDMFYRASVQSDGSGLGLYIVKNAIDKLGGILKVKSDLGKGTTFELKLPNHTLVPNTGITA